MTARGFQMGSTTAWRVSLNELSCDLDRFHLVVRMVGGKVRYQVLDPARDESHQMRAVLASGTEDDVRAAMTAAERMAGRLRRRNLPFLGHRRAGPDVLPR